jgi:hypothetical protein
MLDLLQVAMDLIHKALREGRRNDGTQLYRGNANDTAATAAALLSAWPSFAGQLDAEAELPETVTLPELAVRFIRKAYNRMRRQKRRQDQMTDQVARGQTRDTNGEQTLLDFADPRHKEVADPLQKQEWVENLTRVIGEVVGSRSERDRLVIELWLEGHADEEITYKKIVERVGAELPKAPISITGVCRILDRFKDEMRGRLEEP